MTRSVALMGRAGAGKDTVAAILGEKYGHVRVAFADPLKRMALAADPIVYADSVSAVHLSDIVDAHGWDAAKRDYPEVRRFLQRLGSEGVRDVIGPGTWVTLADRAIGEAFTAGRPVVLTDVRFPNEVVYARRLGMLLLWVERPGVADGRHTSETAVSRYDADDVIRNDGTLDGLKARVCAAMLRAHLRAVR